MMIKILKLCILTLHITACSGTKQVVKTTALTSEKVTMTKDAMKPEQLIQPGTPKTPEKPEIPTAPEIPVIEEAAMLDQHEQVKEVFDHSLWNELLQKHVSEDGKVNYKSFKSDASRLKQYLDSLSKIGPSPDWTREDQLAFWMNTYNAFTVILILDNYPVKSIKDIKDPWDIRFFKIGPKWRNLNEIEHKILRPMGDPRIHFGINCASFSCPRLSNKAFTSNNVNEQLDLLAKAYINNQTHNNITANKIQLSKIFQWFAKDFKKYGTLIDFLNKYSDIEIKKNAKKTFKKYNWSLNE